MAIIELFDGKQEFTLENIDRVQSLCENKAHPGYNMVLTDTRGITKNVNIELIVESLILVQPSLIIVLNKKDIITLDFLEIVKGWLASYPTNLKIGIVIEEIEDFDIYDKLFTLEQRNLIMVITKINTNNPPLDFILDKIIKLKLDNILFLDIDHTAILDHKYIATIIDNTTDKRKQNMVLLQLGCGFPLCMFTKEQIGNIFTSPIKIFSFFCMSKVVIKPDLTALYCNLLNECSINLLKVHNILEAHYKLEELKESIYNKIEHCKINNYCWSYKKICGGGCFIA